MSRVVNCNVVIIIPAGEYEMVSNTFWIRVEEEEVVKEVEWEKGEEKDKEKV